MSKRKYFFVDDSVAGVGGTALTLEAIVEPNRSRVEFIPTSELTFSQCIENKGFWILGNIMSATETSLTNLCWLMKNRPFVKIEFDYNYCIYRGPTPHQVLGKEECNCPFGSGSAPFTGALYKILKKKALHIFYMSQAQLNIHAQHLGSDLTPHRSVLSSCFTKKNFTQFRELKKKEKKSKFAIIDGQGGWHSEAKGVPKAIDYATHKQLDYDLIKTKTHSELLERLSSYQGLIFLPLIEDTCPRVTIEAKLLGLKLITNQNSQHINEEWWKGQEIIDIEYYLKKRPNYFWDTVEALDRIKM